MRKTLIRFFTIADYQEEEIWFRKQHKKGWKLVKFLPPCFYIFESCKPQDVIYRLDFKDSKPAEEYMQMIRDFGWEYIGKFFGWLYFRKVKDSAKTQGDDELFSDENSKTELITHLMNKRLTLLTILVLFEFIFSALSIAFSSGIIRIFISVCCGILVISNVFLVIYCAAKLKKIKNEHLK